MTKYEVAGFNPPAPIAYCSIHDLNNKQAVAQVRLLVDTGADTTLLPRKTVEQIGIQPLSDSKYELAGFDGTRSSAQIVILDLTLGNRIYRGKYVIIDDDIGILGRDILNYAVLHLDGPRQEWTLT